MPPRRDINAFTSGIHNLVSDELIPNDAASDSLGWLTRDGHIELMYGRQAEGGEGDAGKVWEQHVGKKTDGTKVHFRKIWDGTEGKVQYLNGSTWTDVITGLTNSLVTFSNYSSLAGNFVYIGGPEDGLFKIVTANPGSYSDVYDAARNFKGFFFIDRGRSIMWNTKDDSTGLYGSWIDGQDSAVYTTVSSESIGSSGSTNYTGTLAFRSSGPTRTCFGVTFSDGTQEITIGFDGNATSDSDGTGTVNFTTGVYNITFTSITTGAVTSDYQWEDSNQKGVTDFTKSATRVAGEGFVVRQDKGGDAIKIVIPYEGSYFSFKESSVYQFTLDSEDVNPVNELIRSDVGISSFAAAAPTSAGIMFLNTGNPSKPMLNILKRNPVGDNFLTTPEFPQFKFEEYTYENTVLDTWDRYLLVACSDGTDSNNRILVCDVTTGTVDVAPYGAQCFSKIDGVLYAGDPLSQTTYEMFTGFDNMGTKVLNRWESKADRLNSPALKKVKRFRFRGKLAPDQSLKISLAFDGGSFKHIGTILGSGDYVSHNVSSAIGTRFVGEGVVGGDDEIAVYPFLMEIKVRSEKFRTRKLKVEAQGFGYAELEQITDWDIWEYEDKLPKAFRVKQNVSLDGATTDLDLPE